MAHELNYDFLNLAVSLIMLCLGIIGTTSTLVGALVWVIFNAMNQKSKNVDDVIEKSNKFMHERINKLEENSRKDDERVEKRIDLLTSKIDTVENMRRDVDRDLYGKVETALLKIAELAVDLKHAITKKQ